MLTLVKGGTSVTLTVRKSPIGYPVDDGVALNKTFYAIPNCLSDLDRPSSNQ